MHTKEILVGPTVLQLPVVAAVARRQNCPAVPDHPACTCVDKNALLRDSCRSCTSAAPNSSRYRASPGSFRGSRPLCAAASETHGSATGISSRRTFVIVATSGALEVRFEGLSWMVAIFYAVRPAVIALILHATHRLEARHLGMEGWPHAVASSSPSRSKCRDVHLCWYR